MEKPKAAERQTSTGDFGGLRPLGPSGPKGQDENRRSDAIAVGLHNKKRRTNLLPEWVWTR